VIKFNLSTEMLQKLRRLTKSKGNFYNFLGFTLNLKTGALIDKLGNAQINNFNEWDLQVLTTLLDHYSNANPIPFAGRLIKFKDIPGGYAYEGAFEKRAIQPVAQYFSDKPDEMLKAAKKIGGSQGNIGDASFIVEALKGIPLTYILWKAEEFPASSNILYDESASNYLPTEDLAVLGEITTSRLIFAGQMKEIV
jgi:hypothetical protein